VTKIDNDFMSDCYNLKIITNMSFYKVERIGGQFMKHCDLLKSIDLSSLTMLKKIPKYLLSKHNKSKFLINNITLKNVNIDEVEIVL
jgi:hypothetical protein